MKKNPNVLSNHIHLMEDFQYSINIGYDLYSDEKIKNYIPTASAIDIIEDVVLSTSATSTDRARIYTGPYGKGKSHLALVLLSILCRNDKSLYTDIMATISKSKPELCSYIESYHKSNKRLLPVVIQGSGLGIKQSLLIGLRRALETVELENFMPETFFKAAVQKIEEWKTDFPETFTKFSNGIGVPVSDFVNELSLFNYSYYEKFINIYPSLTSNSEFNPVKSIDIIDLYTEVAKKINSVGYSGIFVVYDEFSKYLEGNIKNIPGEEIETLQKFAECCNRSKANQLHLLLISHKNILNYVDDLSKTNVDAWKAVSNRFKSIELNTSSAQTYDLISKVIQHDDLWYKDFKLIYDNNFTAVFNNWNQELCFSDIPKANFENLIYSCYPLSPASLYILPKISEAIAQNERTLFTFLSAKTQKHTLPNYLKNLSDNDFELLTPDTIFDYFEPLFKNESYDKPIHKFWKSAVVAIEKLSSEQQLEKKLLKTLALIYIVNRFDALPPSMTILTKIYSYGKFSSQDVVSSLMNLKEAGLLRVLDGKNHLRIAEHTAVDINKLIASETEKAKITTNLNEILNSFTRNLVLYPNAYNDDNCVTRFFPVVFITSKELVNGFDVNHYLEHINAEGVIFAVIPDINYPISDGVLNELDQRVLFIIPKQDDVTTEQFYKYWAIQNYIKNSDDSIVNEELSYSLADLESAIENYIDNYLRPEKEAAMYYHLGIQKKLKRRSSLSALLSSICENIYSEFPIINNEMINKNNLSSQATNSRNKVVYALLCSELKPNLGLNGSSQEMSIMRSTLRMKGLLTSTDNGEVLTISGLEDKKLQNVLDLIKKFILSTSADGKKSFGELYKLLISFDNSIGLKKGIIPIYVAAVFHFYKKHLVISKLNKEIELTARVLDAINDRPYDYFVYLEKWNDQKEEYLFSLFKLFENYSLQKKLDYSNFEDVIRAIQRWYLQLPKYAKETKVFYDDKGNKFTLDNGSQKFLNIIKQPEVNAREFLFEKFSKAYGFEEVSTSVFKEIQNTKLILDNVKNNLLAYITCELRNIFSSSSSSKESFSSIMMNWYDGLSENVKNHMFNGVENLLLNTISEITPNEKDFIEKFARIATGLRIDDWSDSTVETFFKSIKSFIDSIKAYSEKIEETSTSRASGGYKITFVDDSGNEVTKTFDNAEYSRYAKLLYNDVESMMDEYGEALSKNEKRQVLIDIINKVLG